MALHGVRISDDHARNRHHARPITRDVSRGSNLGHARGCTLSWPIDTFYSHLWANMEHELLLMPMIHQWIIIGGAHGLHEFTLTLRVCAPPTTSFLMYYWHSPAVVIDQYAGDLHDAISPEWIETVQTQRRFWQNRTPVLEMMHYFVRNIPHNISVSKKVSLRH